MLSRAILQKSENIFKPRQMSHLRSPKIAVPHDPQCCNSPPEVPLRRFCVSFLLVNPFLFMMLAVGLRPQATKPAESAPQQPPTTEPTTAELSKKGTVSSALLRIFQYQECGTRLAAEACPTRSNPPPLSDPSNAEGIFAARL
jgi:hypothetical protein